MITTVTLNPAIDRTLLVEGLKIDGVNRIQSVQVDAGGKGINASKVIQFLGEKTLSLGIVGGASGRELVAMLDAKGLKHYFIECDGATRTNTKVVDLRNNSCTDLNEAGPTVSTEQLVQLREKLCECAGWSEILLLSGNAQASIPTSVYADFIERVRPFGCKVILDSSGELLEKGVAAKPWLIKPNVSELSQLVGRELRTTEEILQECRAIIRDGVCAVCVSMGEQGLLYVSDEGAWQAVPPPVVAQSTVGAGDAVVGSLAVSLLRAVPAESALADACAISAASVTLPGTGVPDKEVVRVIREKVVVTRLA